MFEAGNIVQRDSTGSESGSCIMSTFLLPQMGFFNSLGKILIDYF